MLKTGDFEIYFKHYPERQGTITVRHADNMDKIVAEFPYKGVTICVIASISTGDMLSDAESYCSLKDTFDKAKGRKVSLARALIGFSKEDRTSIWKAYIEKSRRL